MQSSALLRDLRIIASTLKGIRIWTVTQLVDHEYPILRVSYDNVVQQ
jgi:hypothetical protein